jgi:hypothetical protein
MGSVKIFLKAKCPKCPAVKEIGMALKQEGFPVNHYDLDTLDGLAEASFYSVLSTPPSSSSEEERSDQLERRSAHPSGGETVSVNTVA